MNQSNCTRCGGEIATGHLKFGSGLAEPVKFQPDEARSSIFSTAPVEVTARMCLDCGFIELWGNKEKLRQVLRRDG